ncbi:PD-(D/E)XK nuclease family protein [Neobacillus sp. CF12]|uniref:PD-(D/E)XK nuclease family protein n=1 Tax=Neobacillus sp. CF12 TaxID=3055864 RepID=UPI0025A063C8|nr:PD-(D/E)XK nuclease family protein [Neobacillus sp. CF12]MDM5331680.1 PD-(D/E)XK nuclease family protein [Neobacillus sp. CF12]
MNSLVNKLNQICTQFLIKEKIVIVDSFEIGEQINEAFIKAGYRGINLKFKTLHNLAMNLAELNSEHPIKVLDGTVGVHFTYTILKELKNQGKLTYFSGMEITPSFSHAIYSTIQTLRLAGYNAETLKKEAFLASEKADDLVEILSEYENLLVANQFTDIASILTTAIEFAQRNEKAVFILQSNLHLSHLEEQFLSKILPEGSFKLPLAPVLGVNIPERPSLSSISWGEPTPLSYLYQFDEAGDKYEGLEIFTSKTEELEVKHVFEKIKASKAPLDDCVVYYTNADSYITPFFHLAQKLNIPITFGDGLPVSFSRPGRLVSGLISWIQSNYSVQTFIGLLNEGLIDLGEDTPSKSKISRVLRELQIGWSQNRYNSILEKEMERLKESESPSIEIMWLHQWFSKIFKKLPEFNESINFKKCLAAIAYFIKNYSKSSSSLDEVSKATLLEIIKKIVPYSDEELSMHVLFEKINDLLLSIRVNQSRPKPGHLHVTSYKRGVYNSTANVFFVGLDNRKFPGNSGEDPLLLDTERIALGNKLPLLRDRGMENTYMLLQALAHSTGSVTVSYCDFSIHDNRVVNPAYVILQCYRMVSGNKDAEFKDLKSYSSKLTASEIFEDKDYWNEKLVQDIPTKLNQGILNHFKNVKEGLSAEIARYSESYSEFDGFIQIEADHDPSTNQEKKMSAGKLETLARCPYSYFLKEVLRVRPIEEVSYDANKWLDPATRGSLLHSIFERFYKEITQQNVKPTYALHYDNIMAIAVNLIEKEKEILPPPNDRIFKREVNDILVCCDIFLKEEEIHGENYRPLHFEYSFGIGDTDPAIITLPSGEVKVSGIIDRVDQSLDGRYHIIDYKTGSTYGYEKNKAFKGGRQLQHMIYALAIEQHLNLGEGAVEESSYYFPTMKGLAQRFTRKQDVTLRANGLDILEKLIDVIKNGHFEMTDDENDCKFCEYKLVCRRHFYDKDALERKQSNQKLKGVRAYD